MAEHIVRIGTPVPVAWAGIEWHVAITGENWRDSAGSSWHEPHEDGGGHDERWTGSDYAARDLLEKADVPVFMMESRKWERTRGRKGPKRRTDRPLWPGYLFVGGANSVAAVMAKKREYERAGRAFPLTGFLGHAGRDGRAGAERVNGAAMQALFVAHEAGRFVPRSERDDLQRRIALGQKVVATDGPFAFVEGIVNSFGHGGTVEILCELFGRSTPVRVGLDSLEQIAA